MEIQVKTAKKYDYKLTIKSIAEDSSYQSMSEAKGKNYQLYGRYVRADGSSVYSGTVRYYKNKAAAIHFYLKKMNEVKA